MIKAVFFDVANTLLYKPSLFVEINSILKEEGVCIPLQVLKERHQLVSEIVTFPDVTSKIFYEEFNRLYLMALGIEPTERLLAKIYNRCKYLPWERFADLDTIKDLNVPIGIISNWNKSLPSVLSDFFPELNFEWLLGSETMKIRKPSIDFYKLIIDKTALMPNEILYVGDSIKLDIVPARSLGINSILIDREIHFPYANIERIESMKELIDFL
ncbi:HAD family hydrolase [Roseivirga pacifica]|uniref:HAD family hydrolase n=1 Tax=Roseivirga pacifica TaxID=1267423 RepID=UPI003BAE19C2